MSQLFKVTKPGFDALTETNAYNFILNTDYPTYKVAFDGSSNFTLSAGQFQASYIITHNLGYIPMAMGWIGRSGRVYPVNGNPGITDVFSGGMQDILVTWMSLDTTTASIGVAVQFPVDAPVDANYTFTAYWKIFIDQY